MIRILVTGRAKFLPEFYLILSYRKRRIFSWFSLILCNTDSEMKFMYADNEKTIFNDTKGLILSIRFFYV